MQKKEEKKERESAERMICKQKKKF